MVYITRVDAFLPAGSTEVCDWSKINRNADTRMSALARQCYEITSLLVEGKLTKPAAYICGGLYYIPTK